MAQTNVVTAQMALDTLLAEIAATDPEMMPPPQVRDPKVDTSMGWVNDDLVKRIFSLSSFYRREAMRAAVDLASQPPNKELENQLVEMKAKHETLHELLWFLLRSTISFWDGTIGLRVGWEIVKSKSDDNDVPDFIKKLLGRRNE